MERSGATGYAVGRQGFASDFRPDRARRIDRHVDAHRDRKCRCTKRLSASGSPGTVIAGRRNASCTAGCACPVATRAWSSRVDIAGIDFELCPAQPGESLARGCDGTPSVCHRPVLCPAAAEVAVLSADHSASDVDRFAVSGKRSRHPCVHARPRRRDGAGGVPSRHFAGERPALWRSATGKCRT